MKLLLRVSHFSLFAYLLSLSQGQGQDEACWFCPLGETFKGGLEFLIDDAIVPAVGILQNLWPDDTAPAPGKTDPAQGFVEPQTDSEEQITNPGSNNLPGQWKSPAPDIEIILNPADDEKCGHNDAGVNISSIPLNLAWNLMAVFLSGIVATRQLRRGNKANCLAITILLWGPNPDRQDLGCLK